LESVSPEGSEIQCHLIELFLAVTGNYAYMLATDTRNGMKASVFTEYINTTGMCVSMAYYVVGDPEETKLSVIVRTEDKKSQTVGILGQNDEHNVYWSVFTSPLPEGINIVTIEGDRGYSYSTSSLSFDDFRITPCSELKRMSYHSIISITRPTYSCHRGMPADKKRTRLHGHNERELLWAAVSSLEERGGRNRVLLGVDEHSHRNVPRR
jgi:hypothetical protein